jgi:phosphoenolpyruvate carboxykinase (GTP)
MGDYFRHWLNIGKRLTHPPKIFSVNWFRVDDEGEFIWPGFGENIRVLKWIIDRVNNRVGAEETPLGLIPELDDLDLQGLNIDKEKFEKLFEIEPSQWQEELQELGNFLNQFGKHLPSEIQQEYKKLEGQLK